MIQVSETRGSCLWGCGEKSIDFSHRIPWTPCASITQIQHEGWDDQMSGVRGSQESKGSVQMCIGAIGVDGELNRTVLLGLYNLKATFYRPMSFYFILNNPYTQLPSLEYMQPQYSTYGLFGCQNDPMSQQMGFPIAWAPIENQFTTEPTQLPIPPSNQPTILQPSLTPATQRTVTKRKMEKTTEKEQLSAKKNSESNITNQFYSFFTHRHKSEKILRRCLQKMGKASVDVEAIMPLFYNAIRLINVKRGRKYVNAAMLLKLFTSEELSQHLGQLVEQVQKLGCLEMGEFCEVFRRCVKHFLREVSVNAILTSKRISLVSKQEHLKKRRKVVRAVMQE